MAVHGKRYRQARGFNSARAEAFEFLRSLFGSASELTIGHVEQAMKVIAGTARSMGVEVEA